jgi:hypothetical protein
MKKKYLLIVLIASLIMMTSTIPMATAMNKPSYALKEQDVDGWWIDMEDGMSFDFGYISISVWWQIWKNNESWLDATAAMFIMIMDLGNINLDDIWDAFVIELIGYLPPSTIISGYDNAIIWQDSNVWFGLGCHDSRLVFAGGVNESAEPINPFLSKSLLKIPSETAANETDIKNLMTIQGTIIGKGIPGFELMVITFSISILIGAILFLRKNQLVLLRIK